jgi:surface antigen
MKPARTAAVLSALGMALAIPSPPVVADPPPWAPAHGWRKKNDPYYTGYTGKKWERDYGIIGGRCNTAAVGAVLGGTVGGAIGSQVGRGGDRAIATVIGAAIGTLVGMKIGRDIDEGDRACWGHALELAGERKTVQWSNPRTGVDYRLTPTRNFQRGNQPCREFSGRASAGRTSERFTGVACRRGDGEWVWQN